MRFILVFSFFAIMIVFAPAPAGAGEPVFCGTPEDVNISTDAPDFCDIHSRRLAYREEAIKLKGQMNERAKNFAAPRRAAYEQYLKDLEALDEERGSEAGLATEANAQDGDIEDFAMDDELMGPNPEGDAQAKLDENMDGILDQGLPETE